MSRLCWYAVEVALFVSHFKLPPFWDFGLLFRIYHGVRRFQLAIVNPTSGTPQADEEVVRGHLRSRCFFCLPARTSATSTGLARPWWSSSRSKPSLARKPQQMRKG